MRNRSIVTNPLLENDLELDSEFSGNDQALFTPYTRQKLELDIKEDFPPSLSTRGTVDAGEREFYPDDIATLLERATGKHMTVCRATHVAQAAHLPGSETHRIFTKEHLAGTDLAMDMDGTIKTEDGMAIPAHLHLNMTPEFLSQAPALSHTEDILAQDPLSINFNGPAISLMEDLLCMDLDFDLETETFSCVGNDYAFLAWAS